MVVERDLIRYQVIVQLADVNTNTHDVSTYSGSSADDKLKLKMINKISFQSVIEPGLH